MAYEVIIERNAECPTAVVRANTPWRTFLTLWPAMLDEVWAFLGATPGLHTEGHNIMPYRHGIPEVEVAVEVGVQVTESFEARSRVVASTLPAAETAATVHTGSPAEIGAAHDAVRAWCSAQRRELTGVAWEIHGHPDSQTGHFDVVVYRQLAQSGSGDQRRRPRIQQLHTRPAGSPIFKPDALTTFRDAATGAARASPSEMADPVAGSMARCDSGQLRPRQPKVCASRSIPWTSTRGRRSSRRAMHARMPIRDRAASARPG